MVRQNITSAEQAFTLRFPANMVGKKIEVIAFEIDAPTKEGSPKEAGKK